MNDSISRQDAIETIHHTIFEFFDICEDDEESPFTNKDVRLLELNKAICNNVKQLPSAQPDLVRCNECEYGAQDEVGRWFCRSLGCQIGNKDGSGYCADAERRTDGVDS